MKINIKKQFKFISTMVILMSFCILPMTARAEIPNHINYQGKLKDDVGTPVTAATTIQFSLYSHITNGLSSDTPSQAGPLLWTETYDQGSGSCSEITPGADGIFAQQLGTCVSFPAYLDFTDEYYLGVKIGSDAEATPRVSFATNPYAFTSKAVHTENEDINIDTETTGNIILNSAGNIQLQANDTTSAFIVDQQGSGNLFELQNSGVTSFIVDDNGFVGIGVAAPTQQLHIAGNMRLEGSLYDINNEPGTNGQILSSTATGVDWLDTSTFMNNIYTADGTLTGDRTVTSNGNELTFTGSGGNGWIFEANDAPDTSFLNIHPDEMEFSADNGITNAGMIFNVGGTGLHYQDGGGSTNFNIGHNITINDTINNRGAEYFADYSANYTNRSLVDKEYVDEQLMWEIIGDRIQPKNNSVRQIYVEEDSNSYTQFMVRNNNDAGNGAGAIIELKGSGADYTNNMYIGKYGGGFWIPELRDNGAVLTDKNLVIGTASNTHKIQFVTGDSYSNLLPVVVADNQGFRYTSDLSATFVDRTLVDKGYVDSVTGSLNLTWQDTIDNQVAGNYIYVNTPSFEMEDDGASMMFQSKTGSDFSIGSANVLSINFNGGSNSAQIYDSRAVGQQSGLEYVGDYSADYTNRSLVDKGYVDNNHGTLQQASDASLAADGEVIYSTGAAFYEDDGGQAVYTAKVGGYELGFNEDATGSGFHVISGSSSGADDGVLGVYDYRTTTRGVEYDADYSAGFTARSLVDKGYVDDGLFTSAGSGLTWNTGSNKIDLGGNLTDHTLINKDNFNFQLAGQGNYIVDAIGFGGTSSKMGIGGNSANWASAYINTTDQAGNRKGLVVGINDMYFEDYANLRGVEYHADYSANYTNRSLVDKEYVDDAVSAGSSNIYIADGTLTGTRAVTMNTNNLQFDSTGQTGLFTVDAIDDRVGVGTTAPDYMLDVAGDIGIDGYTFHNGDTNTYTYFTPDRWQLFTGGRSMIDAQFSDNEITINEGGTQTNFRVEGGTEDNLFFTDGSTDRIGIGTNTPGYGVTIDNGALMLADMTAPTATAGYSGIYSNSGELYALDEAGNVTQLSPHDEETNEWHYKSENVKTGKSLRVDMERLVKDLDVLLGGGYVFENGKTYYEGDHDENIFNDIESSDNFVTQNDYIDLVDRIELLEEENNATEQVANGILTDIVDDVRNVLEEITFGAEVEFEKAVTFISEAIFTDKVMFMDRVTFGGDDVAGHTVIKEGKKEVKVKFKKEFTFEPYVTAVVNNEFILFKITDVTEEGFNIKIEEDAKKDIEFTWQTIEVNK